jgi:hypothetical protein
MATLRQEWSTSIEGNLYRPHMQTGVDDSRLHVRLNNQITADQNTLVNSLGHRWKGAEFFSFADMQRSLPVMLANGYHYIDYDFEPGSGHTPAAELNDWQNSIRRAAQLAHSNNMEMHVSPSQRADLPYGARNGQNVEWYAREVDSIHFQFQVVQDQPATWLNYLRTFPVRARAVNPNIRTTVQLSTTRAGATLSNFQARWLEAKQYVDGVTIWRANDSASETLIRGFLQWFNQSGR